MESEEVRTEVERRLNRPFEEVQGRLEELFDLEWEEIEVVIETSAARKERSPADVIVDLVGVTQRKQPVPAKIRRSVIRWIGKPWRERENPWERYKHRIPEKPPTKRPPQDLEEWAPPQPQREEE